MTVRQLLASIDSKELSEWLAFFQVENEAPKDSPEDLSAKIKGGFLMKKRRSYLTSRPIFQSCGMRRQPTTKCARE